MRQSNASASGLAAPKGFSRFWVELSEWNALICSMAFFILFTAFGTVQNYATSSGKDGAISLAILYVVLTFSNILIPKVAAWISPRVAMFLGSATYALYIGANIHEERIILFSSAALMGFGAALLWVAQGAHIAKCSREYELKYRLGIGSTTGYFMGLFWGWMVLNQFVGNSLAAALFYADTSTTTVYIIFCLICAVGVFFFLLIRPFPRRQSIGNEKEAVDEGLSRMAVEQQHTMPADMSSAAVQSGLMDDDDLSAQHTNGRELPRASLVSDIETIPYHVEPEGSKEASGVSVFAMLKLWGSKQMLMLIPFTLYSGMSQTFIYGNFPALIADNFHKFTALSVFGAVDAVCSVLFGSLSDRVGKLPVLSIAFVAHGTVYVYFYLLWHSNGNVDPLQSDQLQHDWYVFCAVAVFLGVGDAGFNTQLYTLYESLLGKEAEVFANLKFWQSLAMTWGFVSNSIDVQWDIVLLTTFGLMIISAAPLFLSQEARSKSRPRAAT